MKKSTIKENIISKIEEKEFLEEKLFDLEIDCSDLKDEIRLLDNKLKQTQGDRDDAECDLNNIEHELSLLFKAETLKKLNDYILENIDDEELIVNYWFATGIPDYPTEEDFYDTAEDKELYDDCIKTFARILELEEKSNWI